MMPHTECLLGNLVLGIVEGRGDSEDLVDFLLVHAALLGQVGLTVEDVVGPTIGGFGDQLEFLLQVCQGLRVIFFERLELFFQSNSFFGNLAQALKLLGTIAVFVFTSTLGISQLGGGFLDGCLELFNSVEGVLMLNLHHAILLGGEGPKVVGSTNLFLVNKAIVDQSVVDIRHTVLRTRFYVSEMGRHWETLVGDRRCTVRLPLSHSVSLVLTCLC